MSAVEALSQTRATTKRRSLLPSDPPPPGTPRAQLYAWLTVAFALGADPIETVTRFGRHDDARLVIRLRSGGRIVYDRQADIFNADALVRRVVLSTGAETPGYGKPDAHRIAGAIVRAADLVEEDDDRAMARDWARSFLEAANDVGPVQDMTTPGGKYAGLSALRDWRHPDPYAKGALSAGVLADTRGNRYVRVGAFAAYVRGEETGGRGISWTNLHGRMIEVGWTGPYELEQRQPQGTQKVKLHAYIVPAGWEDE